MDTRLADYIARLPHVAGEELDAHGAMAAAAPLRQQLRSMGLLWRSVALLGTHAAETAVAIAGWAFIGAGALSGRLGQGWVLAWALCLLSIVPLRAAGQWLEGVLSVGIGGLLRERLLLGALTIDADVIKRRGIGELLCEVLEVEQIDRLGAAGGIAAVLATLELSAAVLVFAWGADSLLQCAVLLAWIAVAIALLWRDSRLRSAWTELRFQLTHRLVEGMSAHRTRAIQQTAGEQHRQEDQEHERYAELSQALDGSMAYINASLARCYVITALIALAPSILDGRATLARNAITLGGILLGAAALHKLGFGFVSAASAWIASRRMRPLFEAAPQAATDGSGGTLTLAGRVLMVRDVTFTHAGRVEPTLKECTLLIERGDFILLEGESGSGKSTFAALIAGLHKPQTGVILAGGFDQQTLGSAWRRYVALAPQYHENHILSASLGFNLLLGRPLPHSPRDLDEARAVCEEIGLGPLLERMPAGLEQMVGETGWELSQGERSRVFLARALLQNAEVIVLDESFAALDPENMTRCMQCLVRRAQTMLMIAHP